MRRTLVALPATLLVTLLAATGSNATTPSFTNTKAAAGVTEPGVHFSDDGTIWVDGPAGTPGRSRLWRQNASGGYDSIAFGSVHQRFPGGGDSDLAIRGDSIYFLDLWAGSDSISVSHDNGATWVVGNPIATLPLSDRQWIGLGKRDPITQLDTVYALYAQWPTPGQVMIARSRTGGLTWETHKTVPGSFGSAGGSTAQLQTDGNEFLAFAWEDRGTLSVAWSADEGETWTTKAVQEGQVATNIPGFAMSGDTMVVSWTHRQTRQTWAAVSTDRGLTWTNKSLTAASPNATNVFAWAGARDNKVAVAWYGADTATPTDTNETPDSTEWFARYSESLDGGANWSAPVNVDPIAIKKGQICTLGLGCPNLGSEDRELGDYLSVDINQAGKGVVAYGGRVSRGVRIAVQS